ncbi:hypothetical protein ACFLSU_08270 [Bacteroidota bacterium]
MLSISTLLVCSSIDYTSYEKSINEHNPQLTSPSYTEYVDYEDYDVDSDELNNTYLVSQFGSFDVLNNLTKLIINLSEDNELSSRVCSTAVNVLEKLPESILVKISNNNIYSTDYGTVVVDWSLENSSDEFSLEIGNNCMGYFYELNGKDVVNVQEVEDSISQINKLHKELENFFNDH